VSDRSDRLGAVLDRFAALRVLVIGDLMLDEYLIGTPARVSREAPVLVLEQRRRFVLPGGGGNPAVNIAKLGASPRLLGVIGDDSVGRELRQSLSEVGIATTDLVIDGDAQTALKTRLLAETASSHGQQLMRVDRLSGPPGQVAKQALMRAIESITPSVDAVLLSDYKAGVVGTRVIDAARNAARAHGKLLTVDSQGGLDRFRGFDLVKCNRPDAEVFLGRGLESESDYAESGSALAHDLEIGCLMITLGGGGISVSSSESSSHVPASNRTEVFDVTGAGDTVVAVTTLALAASASAADAAYLANLAAGQVVRRLGVATTTVGELKQLLAAV
jgi:D-glycero-beta-D-manno-heptose-7-phosphate kinase